MTMPMTRPMTRKAATMLLLGCAAASCAPPTIVRDPMSLPGRVIGATGLGGAQPGPAPLGADPNQVPIAALQAQLRAAAGTDTVQFGRDDFLLDDAARRTLAAQADWLRMNPMVQASIEGHADVRKTRDHALALGERRAAAVHSFLLSQGVSPTQLSVISWGRERPAVEGAHDATWLQNSRVVTVLVRDPSAPVGPAPLPGFPPGNY